jgi:hypothetical protein
MYSPILVRLINISDFSFQFFCVNIKLKHASFVLAKNKTMERTEKGVQKVMRSVRFHKF